MCLIKIYFSDIDIPFVIILGGTDVNEMSNEQDKLTVMNNVLKKARSVMSKTN